MFTPPTTGSNIYEIPTLGGEPRPAAAHRASPAGSGLRRFPKRGLAFESPRAVGLGFAPSPLISSTSHVSHGHPTAVA
jgi:hypothetical protein